MVAASQPENANQQDVFNMEIHFEELIEMLPFIGIELILNAAFDTLVLRRLCAKYQIEPNFDLNPRNGSSWDRDDYFAPITYKKERSLNTLLPGLMLLKYYSLGMKLQPETG